MPITNALIVPPVQSSVANTPEIIYTSPANGLGTVITNLVVINDGGNGTQSYQLYIVASGGSPVLPISPQISVAENRSDISAEAAGQTIPAGGTLQFESSLSNSLIVTASGRELS